MAAPCPCMNCEQDREVVRLREANELMVLVLSDHIARIRNLECALKEAIRLAPYGCTQVDVQRIRAMSYGKYVERTESVVAQLLKDRK